MDPVKEDASIIDPTRQTLKMIAAMFRTLYPGNVYTGAQIANILDPDVPDVTFNENTI